MNTKSELHLFIIWNKARDQQERIINDMKNKFQLIRVYELRWDKKNFSNNLTRFYGRNLPPNSFKEKHCGNDAFLLIILNDINPVYDKRITSKGTKIVNINIFDAKSLYRKWTGGGHKIHGTNSEVETNHDLTLLLGTNVEDFNKQNFELWDGNIKSISKNLIGYSGWDSIEQIFYVLNSTCKYLVLRNFECFPDKYNMNKHNDIDLLVENYYDIVCILNAKKIHKQKYRVLNKVKINNKYVLFDFRFIGDSYYCTKWEKNLLNNRVFDKNGFYKPNREDYFYSLLYHALIHKRKIADDYKIKLLNMLKDITTDFSDVKDFSVANMKKILDCFMMKNGYIYQKPTDISVFFNIDLL